MALNRHSTYPLIFLANRDEYYERPSAPAHFWEEAPAVLAGKDLRAGGTWLGISKNGRIAAVTNYRDPSSIKENAPSRGRLVSEFLFGNREPLECLDILKKDASRYNGFNLILGEKDRLYWYSNRGHRVLLMKPGIYGLSNHLLDTPWPKVARGKAALTRLLSRQADPSMRELFRILADRTPADDASLPHTGVGLEWESILSPIFINSPLYGTRSSTVLLIDAGNRVTFMEKTFNGDLDQPRIARHEFVIDAS